MYRGRYKGFKKSRYKVDRSYRVGRASVGALRVARVVVAALLALSVVCAVVLGVRLLTAGEQEYAGEQRENHSAELTEEDDSELLVLVNKNHPLDSGYVPETVDVGGFAVNKAAAQSLQKLLDDAESAGISLKITSAYVSYDQQNKLYNKKYDAYRTKYGLSGVRAQAKAEAVVPQAGESEAQTGLLIKFSTDEGGSFADTEAGVWLEMYCVNYGFILRYPPEKTNITAMKADSTAFRYVGRSNALYMRALDKCLEEYAG